MKKTILQQIALFGFSSMIFTACSKNMEDQTIPNQKAISIARQTLTVTAASLTNTDWVSAIGDSVNLAQLSIPGSHDAGATQEPWPSTAKCQNLSIIDQLNAGIRFLDIRCRNSSDTFAIYHSYIDQKLGFKGVLNSCKTFFSAHPNEMIVMSIKEEYAATGNSLSFEQVFLQKYIATNPNLFYMATDVPNLGKIRGKIVLLRRFNATNGNTGITNANVYGIDATNWGDNTTFTTSTGTATISVQDQYKVSNNSNKWNAITTQFSAALSASPSTLFINFASGYQSTFGIPNLTSVSDYINPKINTYFSNATAGRYGIVPLDFSNADVAKNIYLKNVHP